MSDEVTISKQKPSEKSMDYSFLRDEGLKHIESLGSKLWTDYNAHDPGITILETLCYAITDLGYRTSFDIASLLKEPKNSTAKPQFFTAKEVLTCNPVTENDIRRIIIDVDKVKNSWIHAVENTTPRIYGNCAESKLEYTSGVNKPVLKLKGLFSALVECDDSVNLKSKTEVDAVKNAVKKKLNSYRSLCEDFLTVDIIKNEMIGICADIEVSPDANVEEVLAEVYFKTHQFLSPSVDFYSLEEMLDKGKRSEEIFNGPFLDHGFIDTDELESTKLKTVIHVSDIYQIIMSVSGIKKVKKLLLINYDDSGKPKTTGEPWCLKLAGVGYKPQLSVESSNAMVTFYKGIIPFKADKNKVVDIFSRLVKTSKRQPVDTENNDFTVPDGMYHDLKDYTSVQYEFPRTYGIGSNNLPESSTDMRKAQAKQLQGFLLFYDQILGNYLAQLANVKDLLSVNNTVDNTYYSLPLYQVPGIDTLLKDFDGTNWKTFIENTNNIYIQKLTAYSEDSHKKWDRRNRFLDHLIARFGEKFTDYTLLMYTLYGNKADESIVSDKEDFLADYPIVSRDRGKAFDYKKQHPITTLPDVWDTLNVSGLEKRVARLTGIDDYKRCFLYQNPVYIAETYQITSGSDAGKYSFRIKDKASTVLLDGHNAYVEVVTAEIRLELLKEQLLEEENYLVKKISGGKYQLFVLNKSAIPLAESIEVFDTEIEATHLLEIILSQVFPEDETTAKEGMHLIEHIQLRPGDNGYSLLPVAMKCDECLEVADPYSFRISIVLPCWPKRFQTWTFRENFEQTIRKETPAHIAVKICWVSCRQMRKFEYAYKAWLVENAKADPDKTILKTYTNTLIEILFSLRNVHPEAKLHDCKFNKNAVILGHTNLGKL